MQTLPKTVLVKRGSTIDLECCGFFKLEQGKTYYDDGTTVFETYIHGGIADGSLEPAKRQHDTVIVSAKTLMR